MKSKLSILLGLMVFLALPSVVSAEEPVIFRMADGKYYHPASGLLRESPERILRELGLLTEDKATDSVPPVASPKAPSVAIPVVATSASTLKEAVMTARKDLQARIDAWSASGVTPRRVGTYDTFVNVTLAVWNSKTKVIDYVEIKKNGRRMSVETPGVPYNIHVIRTNGVNSQFGFDDDGEHVVVAVKYPIFRRVSGAKGWYDLVPIVYTPWSKRIHTPEIVAWGKETLLRMISDVYRDLRSRGVRSLAFPERQLADVIDPELVQGISVIEHVGVNSLTGENGEYIMDSVFVILATNQDSSYAYSRSSMGAKGIAQFIPSTYEIVKRRTELGLDPDFETGMADARNAIKAMIAYLDAELAYMPLSVRDLFYVDESRVHEYLAASYNAGGVRVRRSILMWGDAWSEPHVASSYRARRATLRKETIAYVKKLRAVKTMLLRPVISARISGAPDPRIATLTGSTSSNLTQICFSDACHWVQL